MRPLHCLLAFLIGVCLGLGSTAIYIACLELTNPNSKSLFSAFRSAPQIDTLNLPHCPASGHTLRPISPLFTGAEHLVADDDSVTSLCSMTHSDLHIEIEPRQAFETALQGPRFATLILAGLAVVGGLVKIVLDLVLGLL